MFFSSPFMKNPILSEKKNQSNSSLCLAGDKGVAALKGDKPPRSSLGDSNYGPSVHGRRGSIPGIRFRNERRLARLTNQAGSNSKPLNFGARRRFHRRIILGRNRSFFPTLGGKSRNHGKRWWVFFCMILSNGKSSDNFLATQSKNRRPCGETSYQVWSYQHWTNLQTNPKVSHVFHEPLRCFWSLQQQIQ